MGRPSFSHFLSGNKITDRITKTLETLNICFRIVIKRERPVLALQAIPLGRHGARSVQWGVRSLFFDTTELSTPSILQLCPVKQGHLLPPCLTKKNHHDLRLSLITRAALNVRAGIAHTIVSTIRYLTVFNLTVGQMWARSNAPIAQYSKMTTTLPATNHAALQPINKSSLAKSHSKTLTKRR